MTFDRFDATLTVTFQDNLSGMDLASMENSAFYHLSAKPLAKYVHVLPLILPTSITVTPGATPECPVVATVVFHHGKELRGGLYMILIDSGSGNTGIEDNAENALSGTFFGTFPTGNGRPGGNFMASIETFHNVIKPLVPVGAGHVAPSAPTDPPAGQAHLKANKHAKTTHANKSPKVVHPVKSQVKQAASSSEHKTHDQALEHLVKEVGTGLAAAERHRQSHRPYPRVGAGTHSGPDFFSE